MERVSWKDKKTNIEVLPLVKEARSMLSVISRRKKDCIRHSESTKSVEGCDGGEDGG